MKRVTGIGGVFFKSDDPKSLQAWYVQHLGIPAGQYGSVFEWRLPDAPEKVGKTAWHVFPRDSDKFGAGSSFTLNYRVDDLDALLEALKAEGVEILPKREDYPYGRFAWIVDPDGNHIELWQPL